MTTMGSILPRILLTTLAVSVATPIGIGMWEHYETAPWTRDGRVRADIIAVAPDVSGLVEEVLIGDNQLVRKGDIMLRLDPNDSASQSDRRRPPWLTAKPRPRGLPAIAHDTKS
jgi:multidrug resistance efflux pump